MAHKKLVKVEMATINDLTSKVAKAKSDIKSFNSAVSKLQGIAKTESKKGTEIITALEDIRDISLDLSADFKKLGLDPSTYKEFKEAKYLYTTYYNGVRGLTQDMKNIL